MWLEYTYRNPYTNEPITDHFWSNEFEPSEAQFDLKATMYHVGWIDSWKVVPKPSREYAQLILDSLRKKKECIEQEILTYEGYLNGSTE